MVEKREGNAIARRRAVTSFHRLGANVRRPHAGIGTELLCMMSPRASAVRARNRIIITDLLWPRT
ncbi:MAG: hypothetical protein ACPMAQ_07675 [Phycisphaerae bacterium]